MLRKMILFLSSLLEDFLVIEKETEEERKTWELRAKARLRFQSIPLGTKRSLIRSNSGLSLLLKSIIKGLAKFDNGIQIRDIVLERINTSQLATMLSTGCSEHVEYCLKSGYKLTKGELKELLKIPNLTKKVVRLLEKNAVPKEEKPRDKAEPQWWESASLRGHKPLKFKPVKLSEAERAEYNRIGEELETFVVQHEFEKSARYASPSPT